MLRRTTIRHSVSPRNRRSTSSSGGRGTNFSVQTDELERYALSQTSFPELVRRCSVSSHTVALVALIFLFDHWYDVLSWLIHCICCYGCCYCCYCDLCCYCNYYYCCWYRIVQVHVHIYIYTWIIILHYIYIRWNIFDADIQEDQNGRTMTQWSYTHILWLLGSTMFHPIWEND